MTFLSTVQQLLLSQAAPDAAAAPMQTSLGKTSGMSILFFFIIVGVTLVITYFAAR